MSLPLRYVAVSTQLASEPLTYSEAVAAELRAALARRGISGSAFSRMTGLNQTYISVRLRGVVSVDMHDLELFAERLQMDPVDLLPRGWRRPSHREDGGAVADLAEKSRTSDQKVRGSSPFGRTRREDVRRPVPDRRRRRFVTLPPVITALDERTAA